MSFWSRIANVFYRDRVGSMLREREQSREIRLPTWLDAVRADAVFGWRQLWKNKGVSAFAILSLGLAMGACMSAFRLIDAMRLFSVALVAALPPIVHAVRVYPAQTLRSE